MTFKIKEALAVGNVTVLNSSGIVQDAALSNVVTAGAFNNIVFDVKGRVVGGSNVNYLTSQSSDFGNVYVINTDAGYSWSSSGTAAADTTADSLTFVAGPAIALDVDAAKDAVRVSHADTSSVSNISSDNSGQTVIQDISLTFDTFGHVTGASVGTTTIPTITNDFGNIYITDTDSGYTWSETGGTTASTASDSITFVSGTNIDIDVDTTKKAIRITSSAVAAETSTLQDVTERGNTSNIIVSLTNTTESTTTGTGALVVSGGVGVAKNLNVGGSVVVSGNLSVNGTLTTINSNVTTLDDPVITLGGDTAPVADDNKDRGVEFRYYNGSAKLGFFGYDDSTGKFTFIPDATNSGEVFSGTKGTIDANIEWADVLSKPDPLVTVTLTGDVTGTASATLVDLASNTITLSTTIAANSVALGTDTTGDYMANVAPGSGISITHTTGEGSTATIAHADTSSVANIASDNSGQTVIQDITLQFDTFGHVTGASVGTTTIPTQSNDFGNVYVINTDSGYTWATSGGAVADATGDSVTFVAGAGLSLDVDTTKDAVRIRQSGSEYAVSGAAATTVATTSNTAVDTWAVANYRSAKYVVQITQGTNYQVSEVLVIHNGTTTFMTEYAILETNGSLANFYSDISGGDARLIVGMATATSANIKLQKTLLAI